MQPYPRSPDIVWPGHLYGTGCISARAMDTGIPTVVWRLCFGLGFAVPLPILAGVLGGCAWVRASAAPRHSWLGCCGVCVFVCVLRLYPATPGWVRGVNVCAFARLSAASRLSWQGCLVVCVCVLVCVLEPGFQLRAATPG